jgi:hypothetical protein
MFGLRFGRMGKVGDRSKVIPGVERGGILGNGFLSGALTVARHLAGSITGTGTLTGSLSVSAGGGGASGTPVGLLLSLTQ